jgi:hypothetical protein
MKFFTAGRLLCAGLAAALFLPGAARAAKDVTVVTDMTKAGRNAPEPMGGHPIYYLPTMRGYQQIGDIILGEMPPSPHDVVRIVAQELAKEGYLVVNAVHPTPDIFLDIAWGYLNPENDEVDEKTQGRAYALVLGNTASAVALPEAFNHEQFMAAASDQRYFVIVTAYDYAAFAKQGQHIELWQTKMSTPMNGVFFDDVLTAMVKAGAPSFGRETTGRPHLTPAFPDGRVDVGPTSVKGYIDPPSGPPLYLRR